MLSSQEEQEDRRRTMRNDARVREQGGTFHAHALADAETPRGRFSAVSAAYVVGSKPDVASAYTAAGAHQADPCGTEPALGYDINSLGPSVLAEAQVTGDAVVAPSTNVSPGLMSECTASPLSQTDGSAPESNFPSGKRGHAVEPSTLRRP